MIILDGNNLNLEKFIKIARFKEEVTISDVSINLVKVASEFVQSVVESETPVYGINTGFGKLSDVPINKCDVSELQKNLLMSHACGVGAPLSNEIVRGMMLLRINALIKGYSGIRIETILKLAEMLNKDVCPVVFEKGSLGASGDLAPLSHMSLPIIGLGEVFYNGQRMDTLDAFKLANIVPIKALKAKEGLSLINGTQAMTSIGSFALYEALQLSKLSNISLGLTMEATRAIIDAFDPWVHLVRGHKGQIKMANDVVQYLKGSKNITKQGEERVQDAYSIRCAPQVHGASYDAFEFIKEKIEIETNIFRDKFVNDNFGTGDDSKLTYIGAVGRYFHIALSFSYRPSTGRDVFIFGVARTTKRGEDAVRTTKVEDSSKLVITTGLQADYNSSAMHVLLFLDPGDSIEFYVGNVTAGRDVYIKSFNFVAIGM